AEDEGDRRQQTLAVQPVDDLGAAGRPARQTAPAPSGPRLDAAPATSAAGSIRLAPLPVAATVISPRGAAPAAAWAPGVVAAPPGVLLLPADPFQQLGVDLGLLPRLAGSAGALTGLHEQIEQVLADHEVLPQRHRPDLRDDHLGVAADSTQPRAELLGVAHCR